MRIKSVSWLTLIAAGAAGAAALVVRSATRASDAADFRPIIEAELPAGFPPPGPVGEIVLKDYPAYRMAQVDSRQTSGFWTLFRHIKENQIAMTAPVEMTLEGDRVDSLQETGMAFLYGNPSLGRPGADGSVHVADVPAMQVVSLGLQGAHTPDRIAEAARDLRRWLEENSSRYRSAGKLRVLGYNSPFVPRDRRYFEVQIPVERVEADGKQEAASASAP